MLKKFENNYSSWFSISLMLIAFSMPLTVKLNSYCFALSIILFFFDKKLIQKIKTFFTNKLSLIFIALFSCYVVGLFLSTNKIEAAHILERRASLIVVPFLLSSNNYWIPFIKQILLSFVLGIFTAFICFLINATINYNGDYSIFFYHSFTNLFLFNAVYMAAYVFIATLIIANYFKQNTIVFIVFTSVLILFQLLLSSKLFIILQFIFLLLFFANYIITKKKKFIMFTLLPIFIGLVLLIKPINQRFKTEFTINTHVLNQNTFNYNTPFTGVSLRLILWKNSFYLMSKTNAWFLGLNIGDFQDKLNQRYKEINLYTGNKLIGDTGYLGYGPHNQFIEILISLGIVGLLIFLYLLYFLFTQAYHNKNYFLLSILTMFCLFFITESVLSVSKGIIAFTFFSIILLPPLKDELKDY